LPYQKIDITNLYSAAETISEILDDFTRHQSHLRASLETMGKTALPPLTMKKFYQEIIDTERKNPNPHWGERWDYAVKKAHQPNSRWLWRGKKIERSTQKKKKKFSRKVSLCLEKFFSRWAFGNERHISREVWRLGTRYKNIFSLLMIPEGSAQLLKEKKSHLLSLEGYKLLRCDLMRVLTRLEKALGNDSLAAVYGLRVLRHLGNDRFDLLPEVVVCLENAGYLKEAQATLAMYGNPSNAEELTFCHLQQAFSSNRSRLEKPFELVQDSRTVESPKVSVIVSLYNASEKLN
jgi:hypothetical protein